VAREPGVLNTQQRYKLEQGDKTVEALLDSYQQNNLGGMLVMSSKHTALQRQPKQLMHDSNTTSMMGSPSCKVWQLRALSSS